MKIAVEGCAHGELEKIYETIAHLEQRERVKVDLLICCGDFQSTRNAEDLRCMAVPVKYQKMCSFYKYYSGEKKAPILTIFIGGNHEASNYLSELAYGGWVAPNIYYLGYAGVVQVGGIRIAGLSGIYKGRDYMKGHFEKAPFCENSKRSVYHIRNLEVFRLKQLSQPVDIVLSHDWPRGVYHHGNLRQLLKFKPFLREDIERNSLGSQPGEELLSHVKPSYWFSAHLHCKFAAVVPHISYKEGEPDRDTKFLALDKCLPKRRFLQLLDIPNDQSKSIELEYDLEWLSILYLTNHLLSVKNVQTYMPGPGCDGRWIFTPTEEERDLTLRKFSGNLKVPNNFSVTVSPFDSEKNSYRDAMQAKAQLNPQTVAFCDRLGIDDPIALLLDSSVSTSEYGLNSSSAFDSSCISQGREGTDSAGPSSFSTPQGELCSPYSDLSSSKPARNRLSGLVLPPPVAACETEFEPTIDNPIVESRTPSVSSVKEQDDVDVSAGEGIPHAKKFKRRNQSLYMSNDDDD